MDEEAPMQSPHQKQREIEIMLAQFQQDQVQHYMQWKNAFSGVPSLLYHYTTLSGLQGIVESGNLWASDVRYMNDSSELTYAQKLIDDVIGSVFATVEDSDFKDALPTQEGFASTFEYGRRPFISCFCETADLLSQWRGYGLQDASVSLGLDLSFAARQLPRNTYLRKVIYDEEQQRAFVEPVVQSWVQTVRTLLSEGTQASALFPYPAIQALQQALVEYHLCFKHPAFREENEWRLIKLVDVREEMRLLEDRKLQERHAAVQAQARLRDVTIPDLPTSPHASRAEGVAIQFRRSSLGLTPYVELPIQDTAGIFTGRLPMRSLMLGPSGQPDLALESLEIYMRSHGYGGPHTDLGMSGVPLRN